MFLLADGVAAVTTSSVGAAWEVWLTPQGLAAVGGLITSLLAVLATVLTLLGKKDLAAKVQTAHDTIQDKDAQLTHLMDTLRGLVTAIEQHKSTLSDADRSMLCGTIENVATTMGAQTTLDPIVQAIQSGKADLPSLLKTLTDSLGKLTAPTTA